MSTLALSGTEIFKQFGSVCALQNAGFQVAEGSIHALVGENGAGKSTLISMLSGLLRPDSGTIKVFERGVEFRSPLDAVESGIGTVHQHFMLAGALSVAENIALGLRRSAGGLVFRRREIELEVAQLAEQTGLWVDPQARVDELSVGLRQRVEILKALSRGAKILLLDEPTAVLAPPEVERLFANLRILREQGRTIVIVTHKLNEVFSLADEVTVLRRGETVFAASLSGLTPALLAEKMIGREAESFAVIPSISNHFSAEVVLDFGEMDKAAGLDSLKIRAGEIIGIAGVEGNGQQELVDWIVAAHRTGLAYIPSDRHKDGLILEFTLSENLHLREPLCGPLGSLNHRAMRKHSSKLLTEYGVRPPDPDLTASALSGGNQQKVVVARELSTAPRLILACNPTRGLDVGAAADVYARLVAAARIQHAAVLLISSDLDEVLNLSDRVAVLYRGKLSTTWQRGVSKEEVGRAMVGANDEK